MTGKTIVLYDGKCPMCTFQMQLLTWLDLLHRLELIPYQDQRAETYTADIPAAALQASIHCVTATGQTSLCATALRHICMQLPPCIPLALILWIPGIMPLANDIYDGVSRNRMRMSRIFGCTSACAIMPSKQRDGDVIKSHTPS